MMNHKNMDKLNRLLYYLVIPVMILEFILSDFKIITFTRALFVLSLVIFLILIGISMLYKKKNPDYEFKVNVMYTRVLFVIVLMECFYYSGFFR